MGSRDKDQTTQHHQPLLSSLVVRPSVSDGGDAGGGGGRTGGGEYEPGEVRRDPPPYSRSDRFSDDPVCNFFRKPTKNNNIRKRTVAEDSHEDGGTEPSVLQSKKKAPKSNDKLYFSTGSTNKTESSNEEPKERTIFQFDSSKQVQVQNDSKATATLETETDFSRDSRAIRERALRLADDALKGKKATASGGGDKKLYKGIHGYTDHKAGFRREQTIASEKAGGSHGPLRAAAHIRVSARWDYQPDICKDYKETGYCGYGDSCKFMHDRGDYKSGWQMEKEYEEAEKVRKRNLAMGLMEDEDGETGAGQRDGDDELPFACFICREPFVDPVMTKCKHYFCEHCALKHHDKNKKCFVCNEPTSGTFNAAHEIKKRMAEGG